ncbi:uncharacterized protein ACMZJ9_009692 [Mantella aurantiaca]
MSVTLRLEGLSKKADCYDIRKFFVGLDILQGGIDIIGGSEGEAFVDVATWDNAYQALQMSDPKIRDSVVKISVISSEEKQQALENFHKVKDSSHGRNGKDDEKKSNEGRGAHSRKKASFLQMEISDFEPATTDIKHFFDGIYIRDTVYSKDEDSARKVVVIIMFDNKADATEGYNRYKDNKITRVIWSSESEWIKYGGKIDEEDGDDCISSTSGNGRRRTRSRSPRKRSRSPRKRSRSPQKHSRSKRRRSRSRKSTRSPQRYSRSPRRRTRSPQRYSRSPRSTRSPQRYSRSPRRSPRSPQRYNWSPRRSTRSPKRYNRSPRRSTRSPQRYSRSPRRNTRSPQTYNRSPRRGTRSPQRYNRSPLRDTRSPQRYNRSPRRDTRSPQKYNRSPRSSSRSPSCSRLSQSEHDLIDDEYHVRLMNLSYRSKREDLKRLFHYNVCEDGILFVYDTKGHRTREGFVSFTTKEHFRRALNLDGVMFKGHKLYISPISKSNMQRLLSTKGYPSSYSQAFLYLKNFPSCVTKSEVQEFFTGFSLNEDDISLLVDKENTFLGDVLVKFSSLEEICRAERLDHARFKQKRIPVKVIYEDKLTSFLQSNDLQMMTADMTECVTQEDDPSEDEVTQENDTCDNEPIIQEDLDTPEDECPDQKDSSPECVSKADE